MTEKRRDAIAKLIDEGIRRRFQLYENVIRTAGYEDELGSDVEDLKECE
jgi:hypothetical protein